VFADIETLKGEGRVGVPSKPNKESPGELHVERSPSEVWDRAPTENEFGEI